MCAEKVVRFIKKCLRGEDSSTTTTSSDAVAGCMMDCRDHGSLSAGSSPAQGHRRHRTTEKSRRGLPDILQSQNICSITGSSFAKEKYQPLVDVSPYDNFQSQPNIYSDTKGVGDRDLCHQLPYRPHPPQPPPHLREQLRTTLQHLPYHQQQQRTSTAAALPANSQQFSQKHLHHLFPPSVHRSMDGEERYWMKCDAGALSRSMGTSGPPPNRTIFSWGILCAYVCVCIGCAVTVHCWPAVIGWMRGPKWTLKCDICSGILKESFAALCCFLILSRCNVGRRAMVGVCRVEYKFQMALCCSAVDCWAERTGMPHRVTDLSSCEFGVLCGKFCGSTLILHRVWLPTPQSYLRLTFSVCSYALHCSEPYLLFSS